MSLPSDPVKAVVQSQATKSDKIRALNQLGMPRARIADSLQVRYQFVRNVLEADQVREANQVREDAAPFAVSPGEPLAASNIFRLALEPGGVVTLPAEVMQRLDYRPGGVAIAVLEDDRLSLLSPREAIRRVRAMIPQWRPGEPLISEELIADRRREAAREEADG